MSANILQVEDVNFKEKNNETNNIDDFVDPSFIEEEKIKRKRRKQIKRSINSVRPFPKRFIAFSVTLLVLGSILLGVGLGEYDQLSLDRSISLIVFGSILFLPGFFYSYQLYKALTTRDPVERNEILEDLPEFEGD